MFKFNGRKTLKNIACAAKKIGINVEKGRRGYDVWKQGHDDNIAECASIDEVLQEICTLISTPNESERFDEVMIQLTV